MSVVRMLRLVRLFTFVKAVPTLRSIIGGLVVGLQSVTYIVILLFLIIYIFAIVSCMFFGRNDPARFGDIAVSMLSLYQVFSLSLHYDSFLFVFTYLILPPSSIDSPHAILLALAVQDFNTLQLDHNSIYFLLRLRRVLRTCVR